MAHQHPLVLEGCRQVEGPTYPEGIPQYLPITETAFTATTLSCCVRSCREKGHQLYSSCCSEQDILLLTLVKTQIVIQTFLCLWFPNPTDHQGSINSWPEPKPVHQAAVWLCQPLRGQRVAGWGTTRSCWTNQDKLQPVPNWPAFFWVFASLPGSGGLRVGIFPYFQLLNHTEH